MNLFLKAAKDKLRFTTPRGDITVEQLFDLPLTSNTGKVNLNDLAIACHTRLQETPTVTFVGTAAPKNTVDNLRLDILKEVIDIKQKENAALNQANARAAEKRVLLELLERKQVAELETLDIEQIKAKLEKL